jgi:hypothetical protein
MSNYSDKYYEILEDLDFDLRQYGWDDNVDKVEDEFINRAEFEISDEIEKYNLIESIKYRISDFYLST